MFLRCVVKSTLQFFVEYRLIAKKSRRDETENAHRY